MKVLITKSVLTIVATVGIAVFSTGHPADARMDPSKNASKIDSFVFLSNGMERKAKIFLPAHYEEQSDLPAVYLIDFTEQHFALATDEFDQVINGVRQIEGLDALVVSLDGIPDIDAEPGAFREHYGIYRDMASFVDGKYTNNPSRTFIGKGSEAGVVLMALFQGSEESAVFDNFIATDPSPHYSAALIQLLESGDIPAYKTPKKLHISFSKSNDRTLCTNLITQIEKADCPWLQVESVEYTDSDYEHTYPTSYAAGIRYLFGNTTTNPD
ncbi:hypothetical protein KQI65_07635 [bacterium]|nr:hypothetical protein [bacterium]